MIPLDLGKLTKEQTWRLAVANGCTPEWSDYYHWWCCGCPDELHHGDSQASVITAESIRRTRCQT